MIRPTILPPPYVFGLPSQYTQWRADQEAAILKIIDTPCRFIGLTMPTGAGKSLVYMGAAAMNGGRSVFLTANLGLMDQTAGDFGSMGLLDIRGQGHYVCNAMLGDGEHSGIHEGDELAMCDQGPCHLQVPCTLKLAGCTFYDRVRLAWHRNLVSTNYAFWMAERRYSQGLGPIPDLLVCDEAHSARDELAGALKIELPRWLAKDVGVSMLAPSCPLSQWKDWGSYHAARLKAKLDVPPAQWSASDIKYRRRIKAAERTLRLIAGMALGNWIEDSTADALIFEILQPAKHAEELLFQGAKKVVLTSATLTEKTMDLLGIPANDRILWECPSHFPVSRRPVIYVPTCRVDFKSMQKPENQQVLYSRISQVVAPRDHWKGLIHSVSYQRAEQIVKHCQQQGRLWIPKKGLVAEGVERFKKQSGAPVLVSPSLTTGWNFPDDTCRFQIIPKLPFPDSKSKVLQAQAELDEDYIPYLMTQALTQTVGRIVRSDTDWGETIILDDHWVWVRKKYKAFFAKWFLEAVSESRTVPLPLKVVA